MSRRFNERLLIMVGAAGLAACGAGRTNSPPPDTAATVKTGSPDGAMPETTPARKGVMVPSDTGIGAGPPGMPTSTGTNGRAVGPTLGAPGNNGN